MPILRFAPGVVFGAGALIAAATATAQTARIFVSAKSGLDSAICGAPTAPCRTFVQAHSNVAAGGEIAIMDPGDYGSVGIIKSVRIVNDGVGAAGVFQDAIGNNSGVTVNAGAGAKVTLRGLTIEGKGAGATHAGVQLFSGDLRLERCAVRRMDRGVAVEAASSLNVTIVNSVFSDNTSDGVFVTANGAAGAITGVIDHIVATGNGQTGVAVSGSFSSPPTTFNVAVSNSVLAFNGSAGLQSISNSVPIKVTARDVVAAGNRAFNGRGFWAFGSGATLRLAHSAASGNFFGAGNDAAVVETFQDNNLRGNDGGNSDGPLTNVSNQ